MDKAYKEDIPKYKKVLEALRDDFSRVRPKTDWRKLRLELLLAHAARLHRQLQSPRFARETARLRKGVVMFHADLIYLRANIRALREILAEEKRAAARRQRVDRA